MEIRIIYRTFLLIILVQTCYCVTRKLSLKEFSNDVDEICQTQYLPLSFIKAEGPDDSINYLWSFIHNPSVLVALTPPSTTVNITWATLPYNHHCNPKSIQFSDEPTFTYGISIQKIIEFNDLNDTGNINSYSNENINILNPRYFKWHLHHKKVSDKLMELEILGDSYSDPDANIQRNGDIRFLASVFGSLERFIKKPSMLHSENSTQIDLTIDKFETNNTFTNSRFAIEILIVSDGNSNSSLPVSKRKNIDDEHTPGVFEVMEIKTPPVKLPSREENVGMYLQWRPISYTTDERDVTDSTETFQYPLKRPENATLDAHSTILYPYYSRNSSNALNEIIVQKMNISFGIKGDSFYKKSSYASWTFLVGYSNSLEEQITNFTILIISIVVALPLIPIILYSSFVLYRRISKTDNEFRNS